MSQDRTHLPAGAVVVGVDGSSHAHGAVGYAAGIAARDDRPLVIATAATAERALAPDRRDAERALARIRGRHVVAREVAWVGRTHPDVAVRTVVVVGSARELLVSLSERAHLLVVGRRGLGRLGSVVLGSVSEHVASQAACPVAVVHDDESGAPNHVVVAVDSHGAARPAVEVAFDEAAARGAPLTVLHCAWSPVDETVRGRFGADEAGPDWVEEERLISVAIAGLRERYPDVEVHWQLSSGSDIDAVVTASRSAGLLVLGSRPRRTALGGLTGSSLSQLVLAKAGCTVLTVPVRAEAAREAVAAGRSDVEGGRRE
jgi:nucleotide-binding universal stress UspA family protein